MAESAGTDDVISAPGNRSSAIADTVTKRDKQVLNRSQAWETRRM